MYILSIELGVLVHVFINLLNIVLGCLDIVVDVVGDVLLARRHRSLLVASQLIELGLEELDLVLLMGQVAAQVAAPEVAQEVAQEVVQVLVGTQDLVVAPAPALDLEYRQLLSREQRHPKQSTLLIVNVLRRNPVDMTETAHASSSR